jgi:hypothetical protein
VNKEKISFAKSLILMEIIPVMKNKSDIDEIKPNMSGLLFSHKKMRKH